MGKFNYLWFRNILLLSAGMWGFGYAYAVADDKMKESPITEQVRTKNSGVWSCCGQQWRTIDWCNDS